MKAIRISGGPAGDRPARETFAQYDILRNWQPDQ